MIQYRFSVDVYTEQTISGWCYHRFAKKSVLQLQLWAGNELICETDNSSYREDLKAQDVHPTGKCGFRFILDQGFHEMQRHSLTITVGARKNVLCRLTPQDRSRVLDHSPGFCKHLMTTLRMMITPKKAAILFMHIPKSAGTTFNSFARSLFPEQQVISHIESFRVEEYQQLQSRYRFISGHVTVGIIKKGFKLDGVRLYSVVREPYFQLHSHLNWLMKVAMEGDSFFHQHNAFFRELSEKYRGYEFGDLKQLEHFVNSLAPAECRIFDNCQCRHFLDDNPDRVTESDLVQAKENVELFELIGLTEQYDSFESAFVNRNRIARKPPSRKKKNLNKSPLQPLFDPKDPTVRDILRPLVKFDADLYDHIKKIY